MRRLLQTFAISALLLVPASAAHAQVSFGIQIGAPPPPVATTDGVHFDRKPADAERPALLAYLRKL